MVAVAAAVAATGRVPTYKMGSSLIILWLGEGEGRLRSFMLEIACQVGVITGSRRWGRCNGMW